MKLLKKLIILLLLLNFAHAEWTRNSYGWININVNKDFNLIFGGPGYSVMGDFTATGNSVLSGNKSTTYFASSTATYINSDSSITNLGTREKGTINSSSANLKLPPYVSSKHIVWAGLFWQGYYKKFNVSSTYAADQAISGWNKVTLKTPNGQTFNIESPIGNNDNSHSTYNYSHLRSGNLTHFYSAYVDITDIVKNQSGYDVNNTEFTVGNVMSKDGIDQGGWMYFSHINEPVGAWYNGVRMGNFGGWSLVVVYDLKDEENTNEDFKNISIYNGYDEFLTWGGWWYDVPFETTINLNGFKTPGSGDINSKALIFGGGGDYGMARDTLAIQNNSTNTFESLSNSYNNNDNKFNGTFSDNENLIIPNKDYFQGMDLDIFDVSNYMGHNQSSTKIKFGVVYDHTKRYCDQFFPQVIAFSTKLYKPNLCYDYKIMDGNYTTISDVNRSFFKEANGQPLKIKVTIRSQESDYDLTDSKMRIEFSPKEVNYIPGSAQYTEPNTNAYIDAIEIDTQEGVVAVGSNPTDQGGTISSFETIYTAQSYDIEKDFNGTFDIYVNSKINFDSLTTVNYTLSSKSDSLKRCPTNHTYDPTYWKFNIEKPGVTFNTPEELRYSLPTQIAGRPYSVSIASYKQDENGAYSVPNTVSATVELELIDAGGFENNSSAGFDTVCEEPSSIGEGVFVRLNAQDRKEISIPLNYSTYPSNLALRNATFRMWVLTKKVNNITEFIDYQCQSAYDNVCFTGVYASMYKNYDNAHLCMNECNPVTALSNTNSRQCYDCLKKYFAKPVCARDNFAIRPKGFSIALSDDNQTASSDSLFIKDNQDQNITNIAAGYLYRLDINATNYKNNDNVIGYYFNSEYSYDNSILKFNDLASCNSRDDKNLNIKLSNGKTSSHTDLNNSSIVINGLTTDNTGKYKLNLEDSEWTIVDQKDYAYKPFPNVDDCNLNSSSISDEGLQGCNINSNDNGYYDLSVKSYPYTFDVNASVTNNLNSVKDYIYANDFSKISNNISDTMALKIDKVVVAKDAKGNILTNYTTDCSADNLRLTYDFNTSEQQITNIDGNKININYFVYNNYAASTSSIKEDLKADKDNITYNKEYFTNAQTGLSNIDTYVNVTRDFNKPMNPFEINFKSMSVLLNENINVNLTNNYKASGAKDFNSSFYVYYGKAVASSSLYDDVTVSTINTPIQYEVYCSYVLEKCKNLGIDVSSANTKEYNWWINKKHDNNDTKAEFISKDDKASLGSSINNMVTYGIDNNISVTELGGEKPFTVKVGFTNYTQNNSPWLIYNQHTNSVPDYLYKVRFIGAHGDRWSGSGKSGFTIDVNKGTSKKSHKIDW